MIKLIKRETRHSEELCADLTHTKVSPVLTLLSQGMMSSWHPVVFLFWGYPQAPRAVTTPLFHCAGNTEGRKEVVYWYQLTAIWSF